MNKAPQDLWNAGECNGHQQYCWHGDQQWKPQRWAWHFGPTDHRVFTTEGDVACRGVDLNRLKHTGIQEAPEHGVTENGTATGCPDKFTTSDGHGSNDNAGAGKGRERPQTNCS